MVGAGARPVCTVICPQDCNLEIVPATVMLSCLVNLIDMRPRIVLGWKQLEEGNVHEAVGDKHNSDTTCVGHVVLMYLFVIRNVTLKLFSTV